VAIKHKTSVYKYTGSFTCVHMECHYIAMYIYASSHSHWGHKFPTELSSNII